MKEKGIVLIVDDEQINRMILKRILMDTYEVIEAEDGQEALTQIKAMNYEIAAVILDLVMPRMNGYSFLEEYKHSEELKNIPVIVSTGDETTENEARCLELGAWDFVKKPYHAEVIRFRVKNAIERSQLHVLQELRYREQYDSLTGLLKKDKFVAETQKLIEEHPDEGFTIVRMDIHKFQLINAFYGRTEGDCLLQYISKVLRGCSKGYQYMMYCHEEADVFDFCINETKREELLDFFETARGYLNEYKHDYDIVPVFGAYIVEDRSITVNEMIDRAKLASKQCKGNYVKNYCFYAEELEHGIVQEQIVVNSMNAALRNEEFILYLQPKYDLHTNSIDGAEVLVRWVSKERGIVSPGEFIPIFERNGFIMKLDNYVWEHTCAMIRRWLDEGRNPRPISVNISRVSLYNPNLVDIILALVEKYEIPPQLLQFELTESAYTSNPVAIKEAMGRLQQNGFAILMDDFGSGYSSLNVLKDIVVDILKIDMKFMSEGDMPGRSENILASVVRMAKWLNMPVVAEGVEREEQVLFLKSIGCEFVQGYYFAKPMPVEEYEKLAFSDKIFEKSGESKTDISIDNLWTLTSQMEIMFSSMLQALAIYEYDENGVDAIRVNNAYSNIFGFTDLNSYNEGILHYIAKDYQQEVLQAFEQAVETEGYAECDFLRKTDDSRNIWINIKLKYINAVGNKHVLFGMLSDVTVQKKMDVELQKYRAALSTAGKHADTILIVDDQELNRISLRSIFEEEFEILEAEDGRQALELLQNCGHQIDLILLDVRMPVMDGTAFLKEKKQQPEIADIPVVMITADDSVKQQIHTLSMGANDYIVKPFVPEVVMRRVHNVLNSNRHVGDMLTRESVSEILQ